MNNGVKDAVVMWNNFKPGTLGSELGAGLFIK